MRTVRRFRYSDPKKWASGLAAILILVIAGCGSAGNSVASQPSKSQASTRAPATEIKQDTPPESSTLTLLTYNVDAHGPKLQERNQAILAILREHKADIMAFQEADVDFVNALSGEAWIKDTYRLTKLKGEGTAVRGVILCSRLHVDKWEYRVLPGKQARAAVLIHTSFHGQKFFVASTHLESPLEDAPIRAEQLKMIFGRLNEPDGAILMGDLNFGDGVPAESANLDTHYLDPWLSIHQGQPGFTWDIEKNQQAKLGAFEGETSRRLDRILVRCEHLKPKSVELIGDRAVKSGGVDIFPSDHFGVVATFVWE